MSLSRLARRAKLGLGRLRRRLKPRESSEALSLVLSAIAVGVVVGLAAVAFDALVHALGDLVARLRREYGPLRGLLIAVLSPAVGGLLITPIVLRIAPDVRGSGIPAVMLAVSNFGGRVAKRIALWRPIASTLSIGSGASLGTEGPVVQMGASIASLMADGLKLSDERRRNLVAVAAASGVAATFNAPIAGVLFALEVILGQFGNRYFASVVIGAVSASAVSQAFLGRDPAFAVAGGYTFSGAELPLYFLLGLLAAAVSIAFIRLVVLGEDSFDHLSHPGRRLRLSPWLRPAFGGLLVGLLGVLMPEVLGRGYETTGSILKGEVTAAAFLLALAVMKMVATSISLGSWGSGGIFAPVLMIGAAFGAAFGNLAALLSPEVVRSPNAYALVGMGAVFSGVTRAPMSSITMIFELAGDYTLILPLLLAAVVATLVADLFHRESLYQIMLSRKGLSLLRAREQDVLQTVTVGEVMRRDIPRLPPDATLGDLTEAVLRSSHQGFVLTDPEDPHLLRAIVTLTDAERARQAGASLDTPLLAIAQHQVHCATPDEPISEVLERFVRYDIGRMPVVASRDSRRLIGFVRRSDLARAYYQAIERQRQLEATADAVRLRVLTGQEIVEVKVRRHSRLAGKTLREAQLPRESIVVAVRRQGKTLFPHGDTRLEVGDVVVANVAPGFGEQFKALWGPKRVAPTAPHEEGAT